MRKELKIPTFFKIYLSNQYKKRKCRILVLGNALLIFAFTILGYDKNNIYSFPKWHQEMKNIDSHKQ